MNANDLMNEQNKFMEDELTPMKMIYLDLSIIKDSKLGSIMANAPSEEDYKYVLSKLDNYNARIDNNYLTHFDKLKLTEDEVKEFHLNPFNGDFLFEVSPITTGLEQIIYLIQKLDQVNRIAKKVDHTTLLINTYPLKLTSKGDKMLKYFINTISNRVRIIKFEKPIQDIDLKTLAKCDMLILDDITPFFTNLNYAEELYEQKLFIDKIVTSRFVVEDRVRDVVKKEKTDLIKLRLVTQSAISMFMNFTYSDIHIEIDKQVVEQEK